MKRTTLETVSNLEKELGLILKQIGELRVFDFDETTARRKMLGLHSDLDLVHEEFKNIISKHKKEFNNMKEVISTKKGMIELERSKKIEHLRKTGQITDMFKTMFGQDK